MALAATASPLLRETYVKTEPAEHSVWDVPAANQTGPAAGPQYQGWHTVPHPLGSADMLRTGFEVLMEGNNTSTQFFASCRNDLVGNPGLDIPGVGPVGIPIRPLVADAIVNSCHRTLPFASPAGQGIASSVCELSAGQFTLRNPHWKMQARMFMHDLLNKMLDVHDRSLLDIDLELDKCLLITPGTSFAQSQRQQTTESVFGTLAICLPSKHDGGDIAVSYHGQSQTFSTSQDSEFEFQCAAWSVFAELAGIPVTSGYQLILTYKLIHRPTFENLKYQHEGANSLTDLLRSWSSWADSKTASFQSEGVPPKLWFSRALESTSGPRLPALFHQLKEKKYLTSDLCFDVLRGQDKRQVAELRRACDASGCRILLANMVQHIEGAIDEHRPKRRLAQGNFNNIGRITFQMFSLYHVTDVDDKVLITAQQTTKDLCAYGIDLELTGEPEEDAPLQPTIFGLDLAYQTFNHTIAIVVPNSFYLPFLLDAAQKPSKDRFIDNIKLLWDQFHQAFVANPNDQRLRRQLSDLCSIVAADQKWHKVLFDDVVWVALELGNFEAAKQCLNSCKEQAEQWSKRFGTVIYTLGIDHVQPVIDHLWSLLSTSPTGHIMSLVQMRSTWEDPSAQHTPGKAMEWYERTLNVLFDRLEQKDAINLGASDGTFLAAAVQHFPESFFDARVVPFANKVTSNTDFSIAFLTCLYNEYAKSVSRIPSLPTAYTRLVPAILQHFSIFTRLCPRYPNTYKEWYFINKYHVSWFIEQSRTLGLDMREVLTNLEGKIKETPKQCNIFPSFTTPLVRLLCENLRKRHQDNVSAAAVSEEGAFVIGLVKAYITLDLGPCPAIPSDWRQSIPTLRPDCCLDCAELRRFVEDPVEQQKDFRMNAQRRVHIESKLDLHFVHYTVSEGTPHILRIIKTHDQASECRFWWKERAAAQCKELEAVSKQVLLRETLGEDTYQEIYACVADPDVGTPSDPAQSHGGPSTLSELSISNISKKRRYSDIPYPDEEDSYTPLRW